MKNRQFDISDISVGCMLRRLMKDLWMVAAAALILAMGTSLFLGASHTDLYKATVSYSVTTRRTSYISTNNLNAASQTASTLAQVLESGVILTEVRADPQLRDFNGTITATQTTNTNFITISVTDDSPESALLAVQALMEIFPTFSAYLSDTVLQVIRNPSVTAAPINQIDVTDSSVKAGLLGGCAMTALLCWLYLRSGTIQTRSGARHALDAHIVATVCRERRRGLKGLSRKNAKPVQVFSPSTSFAYTEQINAICARLEQESAAKGAKIILIAGAGENEGKSTVAANTAAALAGMGKKVALLDCDLRNPSLNRFFGGKYSASCPLNQLLSQPLSRDNLLGCMQRHDKLGLYMLFPAGPDRRCAELISGQTMDHLLRQLRVFDYVILDSPPMGFFADGEVLAEKADASLLVVRQDHTPAPDINDAIDILRASGSTFLGCVLNDMTASVTEGYRYGYGYGYGGYGHGTKGSGGKTARKGG